MTRECELVCQEQCPIQSIALLPDQESMLVGTEGSTVNKYVDHVGGDIVSNA